MSIAVLAFLLTAWGAGCSPGVGDSTPTDTPVQEATPVPSPTPDVWDAYAQNARLGRGVNLGNALEAPSEGDWGVVLQEEYFALIEIGGFDAVRIPIRWSAHAGQSAPYTIDASFFERIDWAVEQALSRDLLVVLNMHHYEEIFVDPDEHEERFLALWEQIAAHYQDYPPELLFEILNEPHDMLTANGWNRLLVKALDVIRQTNPNRNVVIGPASWNNVSELRNLELPEDDRHIIVTFHYYEPFRFTHQGAEWVDGSDPWLGTMWTGTEGQQASIIGDLDVAAAWAEANDRPLYMGEFGAYSKADMESRAMWTSFVARQAEERRMSWAYWEFCSGFGVFDLGLGRWNEDILAALVPPQE